LLVVSSGTELKNNYLPLNLLGHYPFVETGHRSTFLEFLYIYYWCSSSFLFMASTSLQLFGSRN